LFCKIRQGNRKSPDNGQGKERLDEMDLTGKRVHHRSFGDGVITEQKKTTIVVTFRDGAKMFSYPGCFQTYLKILDTDLKEDVQEVVSQHEHAETAERKQRINELQTSISSNRRQEKDKSVQIKPFASVADFCQAYRMALSAEISFIRMTGGKHILLQEGKRIGRDNGRFVYLLESEDELNYPEGTPVTIWKGQSQISGKILNGEAFSVYLISELDLGAEVEMLDISAEACYLLQSVSERLMDLSLEPSEIAQDLICNGLKEIDYRNSDIAKGQETAVRMSLEQPITFVWGPPGTGKTQTLAKIAWAHIDKGERVLMLSYSNVSVDGAILRVTSLKNDVFPGQLVRYGFPKDKRISEHPYLSSYNLAINNYPDLLKRRTQLQAEKKRLEKNDPKLIQVEKELNEIRRELRTAESQCVRNAKFVATTVSKAIVDKEIRNGAFDVVIFDEASMATIPQIAYAAKLARKNFVCMGDFRQLPPIVQSSKESPLNADIFQYCGITQAVDQGSNHKWLCLLDTQYRMHPEIADFAGRSIYNGLLKSANGMTEKREKTVMAEPFAGRAMEFVDLSGTMSTCIKSSDDSHANVLSAFVTFSLALKAAQTQEVGIITPYHAQSRLLHAMVRDVNELEALPHAIKCATVHQFQGSEEDVIVYDAVDCYRLPFPGALIASTAGRYADRLFNVAMTRSKGKFICVANGSFMRNKGMSENLMFMQMLKSYRTTAPMIPEIICPNDDLEKYYFDFVEKENQVDEFIKDLATARREVRIDIPDSPANSDINTTRIAQALAEAQSRGVKVFVRAESKKNLHPTLKYFAVENHYLTDPIALIDKTVTWFGMPESAACFKIEGRTSAINNRPCIRFWGTHTAKILYGLLEMSHVMDQAKTVEKDAQGNLITDKLSDYVLAHKKCPVCGKPMQLKKSRNQKYFLSCSGYPSCKHTEFVETEFVEEYFYHKGNKNGMLCPRCGCSLEAKISRYGIYVQCCGGKRHKYGLDEI
jgi:translation initiation factor 2 beta subunit (eIF-2beta)/eIF-5